MKSRRLCSWGLLGISALLSLGLAGCGSSSSQGQGTFYKVEYYTDYAGIGSYSDLQKVDTSSSTDASKQDATTPVYLGYQYVLASNSKTRPTSFVDKSVYDSSTQKSGNGTYNKASRQAAVTGHHYVFSGWKGNYPDAASTSVKPTRMGPTSGGSEASSTQTSETSATSSSASVSSAESSSSSSSQSSSIEYTPGAAVNTNYIEGDCKLFAYFVSALDTYTVRFLNWDGSEIASIQGDYQVALTGDPLTTLNAVPTNPAHNMGSDPYYLDYSNAFLGYTYSYDDHGTTVSGTIAPGDIAALKTSLAAGLTRSIDYKASYLDSASVAKKNYTVTYVSAGGSPSVSADVLDQQTVTYDTAATFAGTLPTIAGKTFSSWSGTYGKAYDATVDASLEGKPVDLAHLRGNCYVNAVYVDAAVTYTVSFESNGGSAITAQSVDANGLVKKPSDPTLTDYTFVAWYKEAALTTLWDFAKDTVTANITLYAAYAKTTLSASTAEAGTFTYTFTNPLSGYQLSAYVAGTDTVLNSSDWALVSFPAAYPFVSVAPSTFNLNKTLTAVTFPSTLKSIGSNAFNGCSALTTLDLGGACTSISAQAFSGCRELSTLNGAGALISLGQRVFDTCLALTSLSLPSTIASLDAYVVMSCVNLTSLYLDITSAQASAYLASGAFNAKWNYTDKDTAANVTYKA